MVSMVATQIPQLDQPGEKRALVLVLEEEPALALLLAMLLENDRLELQIARTAEDALAVVRQCRPSLLIFDLDSSGSHARAVATTLRERGLQVPIVAVARQSETLIALDAWDMRARAYFAAPLDTEAFLRAVEEAVPAPGK